MIFNEMLTIIDGILEQIQYILPPHRSGKTLYFIEISINKHAFFDSDSMTFFNKFTDADKVPDFLRNPN